jgi:hypothetical protein
MRQPPRLMLSPLTGRIYVATRYKVIDDERGLWRAVEKHDVTAQFMAVKEEAETKFDYTPVAKAS